MLGTGVLHVILPVKKKRIKYPTLKKSYIVKQYCKLILNLKTNCTPQWLLNAK